MSHQTTQLPKWWKSAVVYQIYPYSFKDSTGTGTGDLNGITSKLPYLKELGVDVVWMSPVYDSPMNDMGYDIRDYRKIHPEMGTLEDWEKLCAEAHRLGMKLVMDLVVNHTSDEHEWFKESRSSKESPKKDWYMWGKTKDNKQPNNWGSAFGGSAWEWDKTREEYYLHVFDVSQPDLNWENPEVRDAIWDVMKFWLEKGCDGFRMDVINCISKEPGWPDAPVIDPEEPFQYGLIHRFNGPRVQEFLNEMHEKVLSHYPGAFTVGETPGVTLPEDAIKLVQHGKPLQMIFNFEHMFMDQMGGKKDFRARDWKLTELKAVLGGWFSYMQSNDGWDSLYVENHDQPRIVQRWGSSDPKYRSQAAKMLAIFHATGRGTLFLYQGQEIGSANTSKWTREELRDLESINPYEEALKKRGEGADMSDLLEGIQKFGRDNARMPVAWTGGINAGFSAGSAKEDVTPWIKVNEDYKEWNVESQLGNKDSVLEFWRNLLTFRKENPGLVYGWFEMLDEKNESIYAYTRTDEKAKYTTVCNFTKDVVEWKCPIEVGKLVIRSHDAVGDKGENLTLRPYEGRLYVEAKA